MFAAIWFITLVTVDDWRVARGDAAGHDAAWDAAGKVPVPYIPQPEVPAA